MVRRAIVAASLVDLAVVLAILLVMSIALVWVDPEPLDSEYPESLATDLAYMFYVILPLGWMYRLVAILFMGKPPGDWLVGLQVVEGDSGAAAGRLRLIARDLAAVFFLAVPVVNLLFVFRTLTDPDGRGWHDRAVGTRVEVGPDRA